MLRCPSCGVLVDRSAAFCTACGADLTGAVEVPGDPWLMQVLADRYELIEKLGEGGMGVVYRARSIPDGASVAVKLLHPSLSADPLVVKRFEREAQVMARLDHPCSVRILDFGTTAAATSYLVMEFLEGESLQTVLDFEPLSFSRTMAILRQILSVLEEAHALGVVHRDLKPANIFLLPLRDGIEPVKVLDFGIARLRHGTEARVTATGYVFGTPAYMSPEQARGKELDARSDIYSLGAVLYEMLCGNPPFEGGAPVEIMSAHISRAPAPPSSRAPTRHIPASLDAIVLWAMAKAPEDRIPSAVEFRRVIEAWTDVSGCHPAVSAGLAPGSQSDPLAETLPAWTTPPTGERARTATGTRRLPPSRRAEAPSGWFAEPVRHQGALIGRDRLLDTLESAASAGAAMILRITGAPGCGRRRLAGELLGRLGSEGRMTVRVAADPGPGAEPLAALQTVVTRLLGLPCEPIHAGDLLPTIRDLGLDDEALVGLADVYGLGRPGPEPADRRRFGRAQAFRRLLGQLALRRPLALLCEDLDRYDPASREVMLAATLVDPSCPVVLVLTHEPGLAALWPPTVREVRVPGLAPAEATKLLREAAGLSPGPRAVSRLIEAAQGNPLHLLQGAAQLRACPDEELPGGLADLLAVRMAALPPPLAAALQAAAVLGDDLDAGSLERVLAGPVPATVILDALVSRSFLARLPEGHRFVHPHLGLLVHDAIPAPERARLHLQVAEELAGRSGGASRLSHHLWHSSQPERAVEPLLDAGERCLQALADAAAQSAFQRALSLLPGPGGRAVTVEQRGHWLRAVRGLVLALAAAGETESASTVQISTASLAEAAGWHVEAALLETLDIG